MQQSDWHGVFPAITTPFNEDGSIDHTFLAAHASWMIDAGCRGVVALGSLGEGGCLEPDERNAVLKTLVVAVGNRVPVIAGIAALSTAQAVTFANDARDCGCRGLMVLPPYVYRGRWEETRAHFSAVISATPLSCTLYNNPIAYGTDLLPEHIADLAALHTNVHAVKESSADVRRFPAIRYILGPRLALFVGVDDLIVEGVAAGAIGWVAGLVNALPAESVSLFDLAARGHSDELDRLYKWFLPLLRLDVVSDFVHLIKLAQQEAGMGTERVRPPRLTLTGEPRKVALQTIRVAMKSRP